MTVIVAAPVPGLPLGSDRLESTHIRGVLVALPCFDWCVSDHHAEDNAFVEDFNHASAPVEVKLPNGDELFSARLTSYPHLGVAPKVAVDYADECTELDAAQVEALADRFISAASQLRGLARQIGGVR